MNTKEGVLQKPQISKNQSKLITLKQFNMNQLTELFVPSLINIDTSILKPSGKTGVTTKTRLIRSSENDLFGKGTILENCCVNSRGEVIEFHSPSKGGVSMLEDFGIEIYIEGRNVYLDYKLRHSNKKSENLSSILGFQRWCIVSGNLDNETFENIQYRLEGVLDLFTIEWTRVGNSIFPDEYIEELNRTCSPIECINN